MDSLKNPGVDEEEDIYDDFEYNEELESILVAAESQLPGPPPLSQPIIVDAQAIEGNAQAPEPMYIEEAPILSPFERFRRHGYLSVSDLVGTVWCEVQVS